MKKTNSAQLLASALVADDGILDDNAETSSEIARKIGRCRSVTKERIKKLLEDGKLEKVWKRVGTNRVIAYRVKRAVGKLSGQSRSRKNEHPSDT